MDLIVELAPELAEDVASGRSSAAVENLKEKLQVLGVALEPLHPGTSDAELARYFLAHAPAGQESLAVSRLRSQDGVVAAYLKPGGEPP